MHPWKTGLVFVTKVSQSDKLGVDSENKEIFSLPPKKLLFLSFRRSVLLQRLFSVFFASAPKLLFRLREKRSEEIEA